MKKKEEMDSVISVNSKYHGDDIVLVLDVDIEILSVLPQQPHISELPRRINLFGVQLYHAFITEDDLIRLEEIIRHIIDELSMLNNDPQYVLDFSEISIPKIYCNKYDIVPPRVDYIGLSWAADDKYLPDINIDKSHGMIYQHAGICT